MQSSKLLRLVCGSIDGTQLLDIVGEMVRENMTMFRKDAFTAHLGILALFEVLYIYILVASLEWDTIEQFFFWQLLQAEDVPIDWILSIIPKLEYPSMYMLIYHDHICLQNIQKQ